jgi:TPR repeat protein
MSDSPLWLATAYKASMARQLGVTIFGLKEVHTAKSSMHLLLIKNLTMGLDKRSIKKFILEITRWVASKHVASIRDKAANQAEKLCASGQCAAAMVALKLAVDLGHLPSRALMAWMLLDGREGVAKDECAAFKLVDEGARLGCHHCQGVMARCYWGGFGCIIYHALSVKLARESSESGSRYGQCMLGWWYWHGRGGLAPDFTQALALYRLAAAQNLDDAHYRLGSMYFLGFGVARDGAEALRLYQLAAAQGHPWALNQIASCHEHGRGVL